VDAPPAPLEVTLEPDPVIQAGIARYNSQLKSRRNYLPGFNRAYDQERLHYTAAPSATQFLATDAGMGLVPCPGSSGGSEGGGGGADPIGNACVVWRGGIVEPSVFIDELPIMAGLEELASYHPSEFYSIEVFNGNTVRAYTHKFMERMAVKPRTFLIPEQRLRSELRPPLVRGTPVSGGGD
jgi:hypothetical protein